MAAGAVVGIDTISRSNRRRLGTIFTLTRTSNGPWSSRENLSSTVTHRSDLKADTVLDHQPGRRSILLFEQPLPNSRVTPGITPVDSSIY